METTSVDYSLLRTRAAREVDSMIDLAHCVGDAERIDQLRALVETRPPEYFGSTFQSLLVSELHRRASWARGPTAVT